MGQAIEGPISTNELPPPPFKKRGSAIAIEFIEGKLTAYCEYTNPQNGTFERKYYDVENPTSAKEFVAGFIDSYMKGE